MAGSARPQRLNVPNELSGDFTGLVIGTFGASLEFAEAHLFRQLSKSTINRVVLADEAQLTAFLAERPRLQKLNRSYVTCPVRSPHAHHPKYILLAGPESGRLFVGSGNLSMSGYAGPGECFTVHEWRRDDPDADASPFGAVRELIEGVIANGWIDHVPVGRIRDVFAAASWMPVSGGPTSSVIHNLNQSMLDQLVQRVGGAEVQEVIAAAPFHDKRADAIGQLLSALNPPKFKLLVQDRRTRLDNASLSRALEGCPAVEIVEASAPDPYPNTFLHAKFILVKTRRADVLLQGSANLSRIALCESGVDANVEIANLLTGEPGEFDDLFDALDLQPRADGLVSFDPDEDWGDGAEHARPPKGPTDVCWSPPTLSGSIPVRLQPVIRVRVGGSGLVPSSTRWETNGDFHHFTFDLGEEDARIVDGARVVELVDSDETSWPVFPYHVNRLLRNSASGAKIELLEQAGSLDLRDKELEELVNELDRVLIVDGKSLWRLAHPNTPEPETSADDESVIVRYRDLDWETIGHLPQVKQYGLAANQALLAPTELGIILHSLTSRFRSDAFTGLGETDEEVSGDDDDLGVEQEPEDAEVLDDAGENDPDGDDEGNVQRIPPRQRVRRLWRNFVRRFIIGISDPEFVQAAGSSVIIPSYIVFNHMCHRLRVVDLVDADFLTDAQIALWSFMWGTENHAGYVGTLSPDEVDVARKLLGEHDDLAATLAAIDDAWWHVWEEDWDPIPLREAWRGFLNGSLWQAKAGALGLAAAGAQRCDGDIDRLFADLYELAAYFNPSELHRELAQSLSISGSQLQARSDTVMRSGRKHDCTYFKVLNASLSPISAQAAFAVWKSFEPEEQYFRIEAENAVAVLDLAVGEGFFFDRETGDELTLSEAARPVPRWEQSLDRLLDAV